MGRQTTVRRSRTAILNVFDGYFSETLEMRPALLYSDMHSVVGFSLAVQGHSRSFMRFGTTENFALNSVFAQLWLALTVRLLENNCVKTNKDRHTLSAAQMLGRECAFWQYKVCADIHSGSLE